MDLQLTGRRALAAYLASPLSAFVNGANYRIDGGQVQSVN